MNWGWPPAFLPFFSCRRASLTKNWLYSSIWKLFRIERYCRGGFSAKDSQKIEWIKSLWPAQFFLLLRRHLRIPAMNEEDKLESLIVFASLTLLKNCETRSEWMRPGRNGVIGQNSGKLWAKSWDRSLKEAAGFQLICKFGKFFTQWSISPPLFQTPSDKLQGRQNIRQPTMLGRLLHFLSCQEWPGNKPNTES